MSGSSESTLPPTTVAEEETLQLPRKQPVADFVKDVLFWRRRYVSVLVLLVATATWVTLQLYRYNLVQVVSWLAMFLVTLLFVWGNIHRLLKKELPDVSGMEISEKWATEIMAHGLRECIEEGIRWMLRVGAEREHLSELGATVAALGLLSWIATRFDLLTLFYMGVVLGMSVPAIYVKHENKIREYGWRSRMQSKRYYELSKDKLSGISTRLAAGKKQKKIE